MSIEHYENFPVASFLCPPRIRPAVLAVYRFARTADDLADEGDATPAERLADLAAYRCDLEAVLAGAPPSGRWRATFDALRHTLDAHQLPDAPLFDLLSAFEQDVVRHRYADRAELMDYCARSANPVGRLLLHLYGVTDRQSLARSDAICSALQLANFWQDLSVDMARGRLYIPSADAARHRLGADDLLLRQEDTAGTRRLVAELVDWTRQLMAAGAPLVHRVPGRAGWELRLVVQGGLRILDKVEALGSASLRCRPTLGSRDLPVIAWRALRMRPRKAGTAVAGSAA